ncbi:hypothetical protein CLOM_g4759 [Closterium sp. NIES-68]|nr:hypothetical protein CLOM_g4759 [Closterium sp. NIES-68]
MALPLGKLGDLVLKTLSKPLAKAIKRRAASHPKFRASIANWAQGYHRFTVQLQRRLYGQSPAAHIKRLNEEKAVSTASEVVGELIVFGVAGGVVFIEAARSSRSNARKEAKLRLEREALHERDRQLEEEARVLRQRLEQLEESLAADIWLPRVLTGLGVGTAASSSSSSSASAPSTIPTPAAAAGGTREREAEGGEGGSREEEDGVDGQLSGAVSK